MSSLSHRIAYQVVLRPNSSTLSLSALSTPQKELIEQQHTKVDRLTPEEHYSRLSNKPKAPFAVTGVRNVLANLRCIAYSAAMCEQFGAPPGTLASVSEENRVPNRPYHVLRYGNGKFHIELFQPEDSWHLPQAYLRDTKWLVSGTPVLWDCDNAELFDRIITDAADPSHVWHIPRGNHPKATDETRSQWQSLHEAFVETLSLDCNRAATRLRNLAAELKLERENDYLHSVWGVGQENELIIVIAHGRLEEVGKMAKALGAARAICVENSGSIAFYLVPSDPELPWQLQICAPNLRREGTAFVFFELPDFTFTVIPD